MYFILRILDKSEFFFKLIGLICSEFPHLLESPGFFVENCRTWKVLENHSDPGMSWKL